MSVVYGYVIDTMYTGNSTLKIQVRITNIHGPMRESEYNGEKVRNFVQEDDLPWYDSLLLPNKPAYGDVVALLGTNDQNSDFIVIGMTGGNYGNMFRE